MPDQSSSDPRWRVGADVGGTFTDVVSIDPAGTLRVAKTPSTPADQSVGVLRGMEQAQAPAGDLGRFAHGTTVATNTVLERDGARLVLVATAGFGDVLVIGRQDRPSLYDQTVHRPEALAHGDLVVEVAERMLADGKVHVALGDAEVERVVRDVVALRPEAVAVSLLHSYRDDTHERRLATSLRQALGPDVPVSRSSDVLPTFREYERTSTTALNAYVQPRMARYLGSLEEQLRSAGHEGRVEVQRSAGGTFEASVAAAYPVNTLLSGPAAGAWGAARVARASEVPDVVTLDMGGTSSDVSLIVDGTPRRSGEGSIGGLPFAVPTIDIHTVGAGGGSVGWVDDGGALRVGPRSAGADPGPACYGHGGTEPTVTDANLHLGRLPHGTRLGGDLELDPQAAEEALAGLGQRLGMSADEVAEGIVRIVEASMVRALRVVSVEQGHDPRDFALMPFGGAGALHQAALARELGCREVLVPANAGVLCAVGLLAGALTADAVETRLVRLGADAGLERGWDELAARVRGQLEDQGTRPEHVELAADLRYVGQAFELSVERTDGGLDALADRFHQTHRQRYGWSQEDLPIEVVNLRARASGPEPDLPLPTVEDGNGAAASRSGSTPALVDGRRSEVQVHDRARMGAGDRLQGPAVVVSVDSTCWVAPGQQLTVDRHGSLRIKEA